MHNDILIKANDINSIVDDKLLSKLDRKSREEFFEFISEVEFISSLISVDRKRAKDLKRDSKGRIIVDITNLHALEDMEFFTERAQFFKTHGKYTDIYPNPAPGSEYKKFWDEERRRCLEGYARESDGEWIPGYFYYYLNYSPILKIDTTSEEMLESIDDIEEGIRADRIEDFPDIWDGDYIFFHYIEQAESRGKHGSVLKTRGRGYSFKGGSMTGRNFFHIRGSRSFTFASETEYLTKDGILTKAWANINFIDNNTPFTQPRDYKDTDLHKKASYRDPDSKTEKGSMSEIMGVTCRNEPQKGRGKRGKLLFFDESGKFPGLLQTWAIARKSVEQGRAVFGCMVTAGTGGTEGADFEAAEKLYSSPEAYNVYGIRNVFEKTKSETKCALFMAEYLNRHGCYDKNGNSDVTKALVEILLQRQKIRLNSTDPIALTQERAESPIVPSEAVLRFDSPLFPTVDINEYLNEIRMNQNKFVSTHYTGRLYVKSNGEVDFKMSESDFPIRTFPLDGNSKKEGCVEIFELPKSLSSGYIEPYRYISGIDPFDDDHSTTSSLGSILIMDRYTDRIVAEYTGRPSSANEFYETCLRLLKFYNAIANYENDKKGLYGYFYNKNATHYLCDNPEILAEKNLANIRNNYGNKKKGTNSSPTINAWGRRMQADWLLEDAIGSGGFDDDGNTIPSIMKLHTIRSIAHLLEMSKWNSDLNTDRISAMGMLMILREELKKIEVKNNTERMRSILDDPFFKIK
jgi:hypothetical protein